METHSKSIKIKLEAQIYNREELESLIRWENEGGLPSSATDMTSYEKLPLKPGEIFEVLEGTIIHDDNESYYVVEIKLLTSD